MFDPTKLNYHALDIKVSPRDFTPEQIASAKIVGTSKYIRRIVAPLMVLMLLLWTGGISVAHTPGGATLSSILAGLFEMALVVGVILFFVLSALWREHQQELRLLKFSLDNNLGYQSSGAAIPADPMMFNMGSDRKVKFSLTAPGDFSFANYDYTIGSGKNQQTIEVTFAKVKLPRAVPQLYLNARSNWINADAMSYKVQKLKLEGDFDQFFETYAPPEYQIDALQLLTPDVMQALKEVAAAYDFELVGDYLYAYAAPQTIKSAKLLETFLAAVQQVAAQFSHQAKVYTSDHVVSVNGVSQIAPVARFARKRMTVYVVIILLITFLVFFALPLILGT